MISLFKQRRIKGWWPFTSKNEHDELEITVCFLSFYEHKANFIHLVYQLLILN